MTQTHLAKSAGSLVLCVRTLYSPLPTSTRSLCRRCRHYAERIPIMTLDNGQPSIHCLLEWCHCLRSHARPGSPPSIVLFEEIINFIFRTRLSRKFETRFHAMLADKVENLLDFGNDPLSYGLVVKGEGTNQEELKYSLSVCEFLRIEQRSLKFQNRTN